jgi:hypothetical protein
MFSRRSVPLSVAIFFAEPRHERISTSIGARLEVVLFSTAIFVKRIEVETKHYA